MAVVAGRSSLAKVASGPLFLRVCRKGLDKQIFFYYDYCINTNNTVDTDNTVNTVTRKKGCV